MGDHYLTIFPLLLEPVPKPRTHEKPQLLPGLWLENTNCELGRIALKRPPDNTVREMRDVIVLDIPAYVRGLRQRLKEEGIEVPPAKREKDEQGEDVGWWLDHPLESEVQDDDITKLVMMSCILAGVRTFGPVESVPQPNFSAHRNALDHPAIVRTRQVQVPQSGWSPDDKNG